MRGSRSPALNKGIMEALLVTRAADEVHFWIKVWVLLFSRAIRSDFMYFMCFLQYFMLSCDFL